MTRFEELEALQQHLANHAGLAAFWADANNGATTCGYWIGLRQGQNAVDFPQVCLIPSLETDELMLSGTGSQRKQKISLVLTVFSNSVLGAVYDGVRLLCDATDALVAAVRELDWLPPEYYLHGRIDIKSDTAITHPVYRNEIQISLDSLIY